MPAAPASIILDAPRPLFEELIRDTPVLRAGDRFHNFFLDSSPPLRWACYVYDSWRVDGSLHGDGVALLACADGSFLPIRISHGSRETPIRHVVRPNATLRWTRVELERFLESNDGLPLGMCSANVQRDASYLALLRASLAAARVRGWLSERA